MALPYPICVGISFAGGTVTGHVTDPSYTATSWEVFIPAGAQIGGYTVPLYGQGVASGLGSDASFSFVVDPDYLDQLYYIRFLDPARDPLAPLWNGDSYLWFSPHETGEPVPSEISWNYIDPDSLVLDGVGVDPWGISSYWYVTRVSDSNLMASGPGTYAIFSFLSGAIDDEYELNFYNYGNDTWGTPIRFIPAVYGSPPVSLTCTIDGCTLTIETGVPVPS